MAAGEDPDIPFYERVLNRLSGPDTIDLDETDFWTGALALCGPPPPLSVAHYVERMDLLGQIALSGGLPALYNVLTPEETALVLHPAAEQMGTRWFADKCLQLAADCCVCGSMCWQCKTLEAVKTFAIY